MPETQAPSALRACIDVGTNSIKLLIADLSTETASPVYEVSASTRLGEGMAAQGNRLREAPMRRSLDAISGFRVPLGNYNVSEVACVGTAALRDAHNASEFVDRVRADCGINIEVITGAEEARLSFLAVDLDPHWRGSRHLRVIDVGGGSTELIDSAPTDPSSIGSRVSVNIGAVKLTEMYLKSNPPTVAQLTAANAAAEAAFLAASEGRSGSTHEGTTVVGVGGTLTTLAAMCIGGIKNSEKIHGYRLQAEDLELQIKRLSVLTTDERCQLDGLDARRADIILGGAIVLSHALSTIHSGSIDVSTRGLRWGVLYDRYLK